MTFQICVFVVNSLTQNTLGNRTLSMPKNWLALSSMNVRIIIICSSFLQKKYARQYNLTRGVDAYKRTVTMPS